jgi:hypothetical protein
MVDKRKEFVEIVSDLCDLIGKIVYDEQVEFWCRFCGDFVDHTKDDLDCELLQAIERAKEFINRDTDICHICHKNTTDRRIKLSDWNGMEYGPLQLQPVCTECIAPCMDMGDGHCGGDPCVCQMKGQPI